MLRFSGSFLSQCFPLLFIAFFTPGESVQGGNFACFEPCINHRLRVLEQTSLARSQTGCQNC